MLYIRTANEIHKVESNHDGFVLVKNKIINYNEIIKYSETLDDLCDEFVKITQESKKPQIIDKMNFKYIRNNCIYKVIFGAIWKEVFLPNGESVFKLEPVAIMNKNGDLELIEN